MTTTQNGEIGSCTKHITNGPSLSQDMCRKGAREGNQVRSRLAGWRPSRACHSVVMLEQRSQFVLHATQCQQALQFFGIRLHCSKSSAEQRGRLIHHSDEPGKIIGLDYNAGYLLPGTRSTTLFTARE
jgi:hypothetical protein